MPLTPREFAKRRTLHITRRQLRIELGATRWHAGQRLAPLVIEIVDRDLPAPRTVMATINVDEQPARELIRDLSRFVGGAIDWRFELAALCADVPPREPVNGVVWNGTLERRQLVSGLSQARGSSWPDLAAAFADKVGEGQLDAETQAERRAARAAAILAGKAAAKTRTQEQSDGQVLKLLERGCSYREVVRELGVSLHIVRRVARAAGIRRSMPWQQ
jgi:hypothetical protein